jgi:hypothetical protein
MKESLFIDLVNKYFAPVVGRVKETINGKKEEEKLLHETMLTEEYSPDLKWESTDLQTSIVAADVVSLDSSLPLKKRDVISKAIGKIPKLGLKFKLDESDITNINIMRATGATERDVVARLLNNVPRAVGGIKHQVEIMFQQGLSTGEALVSADETMGTGVRANYGFKEENIFHCTAGVWGSGTEKPIDDIQQLFDKARENGDTISDVYMSGDYFRRLRNSTDGKTLAANSTGVVVVDKANLVRPTISALLEALTAEFGATFHVVDSTFRVEGANGERRTIRPWEQANVVGVVSNKVGRLVYGRLAEETNPVSGVVYQKANSYILVSQFSKNEPLREFTSAQAFVLPVIDGGNSVYVLHADAEGEANFKVGLTHVEFGKSASSKVVDTHYDGEGKLTATSNVAWATTKVSRDKVTIYVTENTGDAERNGSVTVSDGITSVAISVNQSNE